MIDVRERDRAEYERLARELSALLDRPEEEVDVQVIAATCRQLNEYARLATEAVTLARFRKFVASEIEGFQADVAEHPGNCGLSEPYRVDPETTRTVCSALAEYLAGGFDVLEDEGWEGIRPEAYL